MSIKIGSVAVGMPAASGLGLKRGAQPPCGVTVRLAGSEQESKIIRPVSVTGFK